MTRDNAFGQQVRQRRRTLDLTQDELARRVGCAAITLRKIEAGDARPSQQIAERLAMALAIPLDERAEFVRQARSVHPDDRLPEEPLTPQVMPEEIGHEDLSGRAIHSYTLHDKIGAGAFGVVYRAVQPFVEREVAIKIILPQYANHPDFIRRFEAEAQLVARLEHPHIVPLYDYWRDPGVAYLVMRLLRGGNVQELLQQGALPLEITSRIIEQVGSALHTAHRAGVVHRDLKPSNVLLDEDGNAYLADFGIAKNLSEPVVPTPAGQVIGSPAYLAPEQLNSEPIRPQADIYSLGVMLYELLTGSRPFLGPTPNDLIQQHLYTPLPPLAANRSGLPEALDQIIACATAKNPNERYADVDQLLIDFHEVLQTGRLRTTLLAPFPTIKIVNPYKGLRAFEEADAPDFFGREALTQQLLARLGEGGDLNRFIAVIGPSGSGKSSVVKAGLLPALRRGGLVGSENWFMIALTPGPHPLQELEAALLRIAVNPPESLLAQLREDQRGLLRAINRILPANDDIELVLVIDQFEQVFTLVNDEAERVQVLDSLVAAIMAEHSRVRVIITLRADFVDRPLRYVDFGELVQRRSELVLPLTPDELERAIVGPADRVGLQLEPGLAEAISADVIEQPGALPLLQYALTELYEQRSDHTLTKAAYQTIGGVRGALGRRAEEVYSSLDETEQFAAQQMFLRLVTLGEGTEDVRRRVQRTEVESLTSTLTPALSLTGSPNEVLREGDRVEGEVSKVLDAFGRARLLTFDRDLQTRGPTLEVAHEALLREWPRLRKWLDENRSNVRLQRQLAAEAVGWLESDRDASFLLRGSRLQHFDEWAQTTTIALTRDERDFLDTSIAERQTYAAAEADRQQRELEAAHKLAQTESARAEEQTQAANRLRTRNRLIAAAGMLALLLAVLAGAFGVQSNQNALQAQASAATAQAETHIRATQQAVAEANFMRAEAQRLASEANNLLLSGGSVEQVALLTIRSMNLEYSAQGDIALASASEQNYPRQLLRGHTGHVYGVAYSPDGKYLLTGGQDGTARLWDVQTGQQIRQLDAQSADVYSIAFSPDGQLALTGGDDNDVKLWDVKTGQLVRAFTHPIWVFAVTFSPDGRYAITATPSGHVYLWDIQTGKVAKEFIEQEALSSAVMSPDGKQLAAGSYYGSAHLWDVETGQKIYTFSGNTSGANTVAFSPDGKYLLTASNDKTARLWDVQTGREVRPFLGHSAEVIAAAFSPDGRYVATCGFDRTARVWEAQSGQQVRTFSAHTQGVESAVFSPDGKNLATAGDDGSVRIWEVNPNPPLPEFNGHSGAVRSVAFSPDGQYVLTGSDDNSARLWDARTGQQLRTFSGHDDQIRSAAFSPDGKQALTASFDWTMRLWDVETGKELQRFSLDTDYGRPTSVAFLPDGKHAVAGYLGTVAAIWSLDTGQPIDMLTGHTNGIFGVAVSPDGKYALTASADQRAILWNLSIPSEIRQFLGHTDEVGTAVFSPDGKSLLTGSLDKTARVWDTQTGRELQRFVGHTAAVKSVAFSPDGKSVATGSLDGTARIWDALTGLELRRFDAHAGVYSVQFSPDGRYILTGSGDGAVRLWNVDYHETIQYLCNRLLRDLSDEERTQYGTTDTTPTCSK